MANGRSRRNVNRDKNRIQAVSVVDSTDSTDQLKIGRVFSAMDSSLSLINTVLEATATLNTNTSVTAQNVTFTAFTTSTDFSAFATEYKLFRIKAIQYDVYDTQPNNTGTAFFSTQHVAAGAPLNATFQTVTAAVDVGIVPPGGGVKTWTWVAKGTTELGWQGCNGTIVDYGGLLGFSPVATTAATNRFYIIARAHVQFRSRV